MYNESLFGTKYITNYAQSVVIAQQDRDEISILHKYEQASKLIEIVWNRQNKTTKHSGCL